MNSITSSNSTDDYYYTGNDDYYIGDDATVFFQSYLPLVNYIAYFVGIVLLLHLIDECLTRPRFKMGNVLSTAAYNYYGSQQRHSSVDGLSCLVNNNSNNKDRPNSAKNNNGLNKQLTSTYNNNSSGNNVTGNNDDDETCFSFTKSFCLSFCCIDFNRANKYHQIFSDGFKRNVLLGYNSKVYNGIGNIVFQNGSLFGRSYFKFQQGFLEDFIFHIINFNLLLSTIFADIQSPYTRMHRRIVFFCQSILALSLQLVLAFLSALASQNYDDDDYASSSTYRFFSDDGFVFVITVFVISPLIILINRLMYYLFVCPCLIKEKEEAIRSNSIEIPRIGSKNNSIDGNSIILAEEKGSSICSKRTLTTIVKFCGQSAAFPLILASLAAVYLCSVLTINLVYIIREGRVKESNEVSYTLKTIANYAWSIHVISNVEDFLFRFFYFFAGVYTIRFRIHKWFILSFGVWQIEERISEMEKEAVAVKRSSDSKLTTNNMVRFIYTR